MHITADQYPYDASSTGLSAIIPGWAMSGGNEPFITRLKQRDAKLIAESEEILRERGGADRVMITSTHGAHPEWEGKTLSEIAERQQKDPVIAAMDLLIDGKGSISAVYFSMSEADVKYLMGKDDISVVSDGADFNYDIAFQPHPRNFSTFPRFLRLSREWNLMPLEDAVYKMTGLPAQTFGIRRRGVLKPGNAADITVFDAEKVTDQSDFVHSVQKPLGIEYVFVNGSLVLDHGERTAARPGQVILKDATPSEGK